MRIVTKITAGLLLLAAVGCREMPTVTVGGGRTLAKAGGATLDEQELGRALPAGLTGDDSVAFAELYVRKWIGKQLKLSEAEQLFSASADDIEAKVEAYRQSLLIRKLDQFYVDERIDTTFTEEDIAAYYNAHKAEFKLDRPLVKGRIVRFPVNHRQSFKLRELVKASSADRLQDLADICAKNDFELKEFAEWTPWSDFAANLPLRQGMASEQLIRPGEVQQLRDNESHYYFFVTEVAGSGQTAPLETRRATIRRILFNLRQAEVIRSHEEELVDAAIPIIRSRVRSIDAAMEFTRLGFDDKTELLNTRPRLYSTLYSLGDMKGYFYGALAPSTDYIRLFDIRPYYNGFYVVLPGRSHPDALKPLVAQDKLFDIFHQYKEWVDIMGVPTVGRLNAKVLAGDASELIKIAEAFHEKRLARIADTIAAANRSQGTRMVLISGPSSSGKTTSAKRLGIQLRILGLNPVLISLDDYFVDRDKTPRDADGEYDYEALEAIDLRLFNDHLQRLFAGESLPVPRYDFITGKRQWHDNPLRLDDRSVLIVEGIHGLNPRLTPSIPDHMKFKIYISCFTSVSMDNLSRIATTDNRLLRRMVRDNATRGHNAQATLARWESVRRGEEKHIFPYQENADVMFNSSLFYEISVLRPYAERILREVPDTVPEYGEAKRLLKFLDNFIPIDPAEIPPTSLLREFIGGSSFRY